MNMWGEVGKIGLTRQEVDTNMWHEIGEIGLTTRELHFGSRPNLILQKWQDSTYSKGKFCQVPFMGGGKKSSRLQWKKDHCPWLYNGVYRGPGLSTVSRNERYSFR